MADTGPIWGLVGAFGGGIVSQVVNAVLAGRHERTVDLQQRLDKLAVESRHSHDELNGAIGDVRTKVAGLEAVVGAFVLRPHERRLEEGGG